MKAIRILIVEDDDAVLSALQHAYRSILAARGFDPVIESVRNVADARRLAKTAKSDPYDLVSLDVNLGDSALTGLDVLETLDRFQSAWMVALLTGVETDASADQSMGASKAESLRKQLRRDAYAKFPPERLLVVEKPPYVMAAEEAQRLLTNRLEQIVLVYEEVSRLRYVFRPIRVEKVERAPSAKGRAGRREFRTTGTATHWQIRFNCGDIRTLPDMAGFMTLHYLLSRDRSQAVTPEEALAVEPKSAKTNTDRAIPGTDRVAEYFRAQGVEWQRLPTPDQERLIQAALSLKLKRYIQLREFEDDQDISPSEDEELNSLVSELGPLSDAAESAYQRLKPKERTTLVGTDEVSLASISQDDLHIDGGNYDRLGTGRRGEDSPAAQLFRARMKRVRDCLRENGFSDFARHLEFYVQSTGASWSYNPPTGVEWTT